MNELRRVVVIRDNKRIIIHRVHNGLLNYRKQRLEQLALEAKDQKIRDRMQRIETGMDYGLGITIILLVFFYGIIFLGLFSYRINGVRF